MSMRIFNFGFSLIILTALAGCRTEYETDFEVNEQPVFRADIIKNKAKSDQQYIAILSTNLLQKPVSIDEIVRTQRVIESVGDKGLVKELIISNFMNRPDVIIPSDSLMRANTDQFIKDTYRKFFIREPSELEKSFFRNFIEANPSVTAEMVYVAFASSDEYQFY